MKLTGIHVNKRLASFAICILLLVSSLLPLASAIAAPPSDDPEPGEIRLGVQDEGGQVELKEGQVLVISLESNPSTGYGWEVEEADETILRQTGRIEFEPESHLLGAPGKQILRFEAVAAGQTTLRLVYRRPWEKDVKPARTFSLQVKGVGSFTHVKSPTPTPAVEPSVESSVTVAGQPMLGLPIAYNWCDAGGCTPVKDQASCGSCWAFSTVGALESNIKIKDGLEKDLAEQYLLSCNTDGWSCRGGWWAHDYHWWKKPSGELDAGAVYETDFPYVARDDPCNPPHPHHEKIASWAYVGSQSDIPPVNDIKQAILDYGPVSAAVCVGPFFESYSGGIFQTNESCSGYVNHAVLLVGWNDSQGIWYLKNSWGTGWGESGYMRIKYGTSNVGYSANYIVYGGSGCQDAYESDNTYTTAKTITVNGAVQTHNFHVAGDVDWAKFAVTAGSAYTITTSNLGTSNDTVLYLYDTDGTTELASNNDCSPGNPASCINNYTATITGTYYISVSHSAAQGGCTGYDYDLAVVSNSSSKVTEVFLPLIMKSTTCRDTQVVQNGGFESGRTIWVQQQSGSPDPIIGQYYPHSGSWNAWFGGYNNADDRLYQTINIPAGISSARLVLYLYVYSQEYDPNPHDYFHVELQNTSGGTLESFLWADNTMSSSYWWKGTMEWSNFSSHAGQTRRLFFQGTTDDYLITNFFVDDVTFWTYCGGLPAGAKAIGPEGWTWEKVEAPPGYTPASHNEQVPGKHKNE